MSRLFWYLSCLILFICFSSVQIFAEDDPNPDSPTPVLLSQTNSSQILAVDGAGWKGNLPKTAQTIFRPSPKNVVTLFVSNQA